MSEHHCTCHGNNPYLPEVATVVETVTDAVTTVSSVCKALGLDADDVSQGIIEKLGSAQQSLLALENTLTAMQTLVDQTDSILACAGVVSDDLNNIVKSGDLSGVQDALNRGVGRLNEAEAEIARQLEDIDNQLDVIAADLAAAMGTAEDVAGFLAGPAQRLDERLAEQQQRLEKLRDYADNYPAIQERLGNAIYHIGELRDLLKKLEDPSQLESWNQEVQAKVDQVRQDLREAALRISESVNQRVEELNRDVQEKLQAVQNVFDNVSGGLTALGQKQLALYLVFCGLLLILALAIGRRSRPPAQVQLPVEKRRLSRRTTAAAASILLLIPVTLFVGVYYLNNQRYGLVSVLVLLECMAPFFLVFEGRRPQARELVVIAVLCAISVAGRAAFFMLPQFKPVMALTIIAGVAFGGETGFLVGAMTMLASNVLFGQGPLTPWQMFAMGIIGFLAGLLFRKGLLRRNRGALCVFGALAAILIYGGIMNPASALTWVGELNEKVLLTYYISGLPFDCIQAAATWLFLWFGAEPMLEKLDRIKEKYGLLL